METSVCLFMLTLATPTAGMWPPEGFLQANVALSQETVSYTWNTWRDSSFPALFLFQLITDVLNFIYLDIIGRT